ncbi:hypothetical protein DICSQDRAFT_136586 [Dichomitus squalens LYAD-421 SS1]|uniref:Secreted protein n=2 Tax=Dichomitus squalens TaxID=114155 RepID=A0A4Q9PH89_9APHY|nr:uncharacterized protein DICSQDRAFT_136586 [Dichomitus squalens LYAD-421 SS1]EJF61381.1 hypothetical protein DICSQDRAFT_136586 [Dichomitus squalens LYAD-421 SS1]TBU52136.1 hypothetical protein BD310DRAFT_832853 [Dichomitus squalens]
MTMTTPSALLLLRLPCGLRAAERPVAGATQSFPFIRVASTCATVITQRRFPLSRDVLLLPDADASRCHGQMALAAQSRESWRWARCPGDREETGKRELGGI